MTACSGVTARPSIATGTPLSKVMTTSSGSCATAGSCVYAYSSSIGAFQMSSRKPVSTARPHRFWSIEYGDLCVTSIGRPFSSAYAIALSRVQAKSRAGAMTLQVGRQRADADLEADLVVALAGAAVRDEGAAVYLAPRRPGA